MLAVGRKSSAVGAEEMAELNAATDELGDLIEQKATAPDHTFIDPRSAFAGRLLRQRRSPRLGPGPLAVDPHSSLENAVSTADANAAIDGYCAP